MMGFGAEENLFVDEHFFPLLVSFFLLIEFPNMSLFASENLKMKRKKCLVKKIIRSMLSGVEICGWLYDFLVPMDLLFFFFVSYFSIKMLRVSLLCTLICSTVSRFEPHVLYIIELCFLVHRKKDVILERFAHSLLKMAKTFLDSCSSILSTKFALRRKYQI